jgi:hypothetical protein
MSSQISSLFFDQKFLGTYIFGLFIIVLYAKDKFNMPTYDRSAMGPFAQLPPQSLTMDQRYRHGRTIYLFILLCLYTAICVVGPSTFPDLFSIFKNVDAQYQLGPQATNKEMWPVAAATFLISTGASNDNSILGKIEYFIRQYAHKTAYIPKTVRDLARYFREIDGIQWLTEPEREEERAERRNRLMELVGEGALKEFEAKKEEVGGELIRWIRANILYFTLQRLFDKAVETVEGRLDELTDLPANKEIFTSLTGNRRELYEKLVDPAGNFQPGKVEAARFAKDVSLMLSVLLSQGARNQSELDDYIKRLGLAEIHFHPSDSSTFVTAVNVWMFVGVLVAGIVIFVGYMSPEREYFDLIGGGTSKDLSELTKSVDIFPWLSTMINATLSYLVAFRILVYCRDAAMESREWSETFASRFRVVAIASSVSSIFSVVAIVLFFSIIDKLHYVINGPADLAYLLLLQFALSLILSSFGLVYLHYAPQMPFAGRLVGQPQSAFSRIIACVKQPAPWVHALCAAILVGSLSLLVSVNVRGIALGYVSQAYDQALDGILTSQKFIKMRLEQQAEPAPLTAAVESSGLKPVEYDDGKKKSAEDAKKKVGVATDALINSMFEELKLTPVGPIWDINRSLPPQDAMNFKCPAEKPDPQSPHTRQSLCLVAQICQSLNGVQLSPPPSASDPLPDCSRQPSPQGGGAQSLASSAMQPPGRSDAKTIVTIPYTLFKNADTCTPYSRQTMDCREAPLLGLGISLAGYYQSLSLFDRTYRSSRYFATTIVPTLVAFFVAYAFGVGCLLFRAGWLREGVDEPQGRKLIAEIRKHYGLDSADIEASLAIPLKPIGGLTPLEALRYEEFSIKLFDIIKDKKNRIDEFLALKRSERAHT